ncbi:MAG: S16 family serine protease, partial [Anaerolineae bacterium]
PKKNEKDLTEIPRRVRQRMKFVTADNMNDVLTAALAAAPPLGPKQRSTRHRKVSAVP